MNSYIKGFMFLNIIIFATSCGEPKNKNTKTEIIDSPIQTQFDYVDREGVRWNKDNIFAPRKNESLNDPNYQKRMEVFRKEVDPYEKGYEE